MITRNLPVIGPFFQALHDMVTSQPDAMLTAILLFISAALAWVALAGPTAAKGVLLAWVVLP